MSWDSRSGLDSYRYSDAEFVYEHDTKLNDPTTLGPHGICLTPHWVKGDTAVSASSNVPSASKVYADNARASDSCGEYDVSFGIFKPWNLATNVNYKFVVGANAGTKSSSKFAMSGEKLVRSCGLDSAWCVSLGEDRREDRAWYVGLERGWALPGCYTWYRASDRAPVRGLC